MKFPLRAVSFANWLVLAGVVCWSGCHAGQSAAVVKKAGPSTSSVAEEKTSPTNEPLRFTVTFPVTARSQAVSGRVLLFLGRTATPEPRRAGNLSLNPPPVFAIDVTNVAPEDKIVFTPEKFQSPDALAFPTRLDRVEPGVYHAQVVIDLDTTARDFNGGPGNLYSRPVRCVLAGARGGPVELIADQVIKPGAPKDTEWVKLVESRSAKLSEFHGRETKLRAGVILPAGHATNLTTRYPAVYVVPGFGGRHTDAWNWLNGERGRKWRDGEGVPHLRVVLDADVPLGHSVFANSANNGPVGDALTQELIPEIERRFRGIAEARARLVTGHSSGGWSSLWLQVAYPDFFGGCWSTAPDPVDFRAFQTVNIYEDHNGHWTREGQLRPVARTREKVLATIQQLNQYEYVVGYGGQLDSFDAVFSPRGADGRPRQLINKLTGDIDRAVAEHWKRYDIRLMLERDWPTLGPKLRGKLHVIAGGWDTFFLDGAAVLLRDFLKTTDHGGYVELLPGDHGSVITEAVRRRIDAEMSARLKAASGPETPMR
jgi:hypothetical protein